MSQIQCFRIKRGTEYDKLVKEHFKMSLNWNKVYDKVSELLGETITKIGWTTENLYVDISEIKNEENKKLFKKDGSLKSNTKKAKEIFQSYKGILAEVGLSEYKELRILNFCYGVMRSSNQNLESFVTHDYDIYYKADFDLEKKTNGLVIPITEIEYQEIYLEELKEKTV